MSPLDELRAHVLAAAAELSGGRAANGREAIAGAGRRPITLERPPRRDFGDYSTNAALLLAPSLGAPPREVAEHLDDDHDPGDLGFGGDVAETHGGKDGHGEVQGVGFG